MPDNTLELLRRVQSGATRPEDALTELKMQPFEDLGYAKVDHHRSLRQGVAEVIYGAGKTPEQIDGIVAAMRRQGQKTVLITKMSADAALLVGQNHPLDYHKMGAVGIVGDLPEPNGDGDIVIITGGTSDMPVAEEAALTAEWMGARVERVYDVGVAGLHRLTRRLPLLRTCRALVVVAGMEGALPSVVGGLLDKPIVAVPTHIGYGANLGGMAALLAMLNSCVPGITVVNIDNGFGAGVAAALMNRIGEAG